MRRTELNRNAELDLMRDWSTIKEINYAIDQIDAALCTKCLKRIEFVLTRAKNALWTQRSVRMHRVFRQLSDIYPSIEYAPETFSTLSHYMAVFISDSSSAVERE